LPTFTCTYVFDLWAERWRHREAVGNVIIGSAALRGKAEDYKTLRATLEFSARGQSYVVDRTYTTAKLMQGDCVLCSGTTPVNKHIPALLGFGLDVFDVACAANQGDIERLGNLRPAERKKMVDTVIGLDRLEEVARWAGEEARGFEKQVEAIERSVGQEPAQPLEEFDPSALAAARSAHEELHRLHGVTSVRPPKPCRPPAEAPPPNLKDLLEAERTADDTSAPCSSNPSARPKRDTKLYRWVKKLKQ
jgi:DNA repair protein SbcC/Rad50